MLETNDLLVKCPKCGAWPMAVGSRKETFAQREISFKCPKCGSEEQGRLRHAALSQVSASRGRDAA
jgi:Zn finger protein HypA/HybF involved in hydrogenase expression